MILRTLSNSFIIVGTLVLLLFESIKLLCEMFFLVSLVYDKSSKYPF